MVRKTILPLTLLFTLIVLTGCPYSSKVPITKAKEKMPKSLYGEWSKVESSDHPAYVSIEPDEGNWNTITKFAWNTDSSKYAIEESYTTHVSIVDGTLFLNMKKDGSFLLYKVEMSNKNAFALFEVTDNIDEQFNSSEELYGFVKKYKDLSFFYNKDEENYTRKTY